MEHVRGLCAFPYSEEERFRVHRFYQSIRKVNIGAFPFLPQATKLMEEFLDELILDSSEKAYERSTRPRGTTQYYEGKLQGKNMMVGSLRDREQLALCLEHKLYRIPVVHFSQGQSHLTELEWLGLYQSHRRFGARYCGVYRLAKSAPGRWFGVRRYEIRVRLP